MIRPYTENDIDSALREIAADDPSHALRIMQPPRDGVSDADDELECAPDAYSDIDPSRPLGGYKAIGAAIIIMLFGALVIRAMGGV